MQPTNFLYILSDQHARDALGCYGSPVVRTPNLDRLAARGARFQSAYTPCPICVPARASLATGQYVHQIGNWDNAFPYDGSAPSWHHRLREQGHRIDSIGKLHFSGPDDDHGFSQEIDPLHVVDGVGDILGAIRDDPPFRNKRPGVTGAGPGDSTYQRYDASNADHGCEWLAARAREAQPGGKPWALFLSFVCPHPPYIAPQETYDLYAQNELSMPPQWRMDEWPQHPAMDYFRRFFTHDRPFSEAEIRKLMAAYYGVITYLDGQIGRVLDTLAALGLEESTRVVYTSDHGESLGARGMTGKFTLYDESAAVPLILAGPDVPGGRVVRTPATLVDSFQTALDAVGASPASEDARLPGLSWWRLAQEPDRERTILSEYHALGSQNAAYMLRSARYKYIYHVDAAPQLFDLEADPEERIDLAADREFATLLLAFEAELRRILDPEAVDTRAKEDQRAKVEAFGREKVLRRGAFENSPAPGEAPAYIIHE